MQSVFPVQVLVHFTSLGAKLGRSSSSLPHIEHIHNPLAYHTGVRMCNSDTQMSFSPTNWRKMQKHKQDRKCAILFLHNFMPEFVSYFKVPTYASCIILWCKVAKLLHFVAICLTKCKTLTAQKIPC